jgi:hypothetical protein
MTKSFCGNNDEAKGWQKGNGKMEEPRLAPFNRGARAVWLRPPKRIRAKLKGGIPSCSRLMKTHSMQVVWGREGLKRLAKLLS